MFDLRTLERISKYETAENLGGIAAVNSDKNMGLFACLSKEEGNIRVINFDRYKEEKA